MALGAYMPHSQRPLTNEPFALLCFWAKSHAESQIKKLPAALIAQRQSERKYLPGWHIRHGLAALQWSGSAHARKRNSENRHHMHEISRHPPYECLVCLICTNDCLVLKVYLELPYRFRLLWLDVEQKFHESQRCGLNLGRLDGDGFTTRQQK